jgi:hypothetical protein
MALPILSGCGKGAGAGSGKGGALIAARLEAVRQAGQPLTREELNAWYAEAADGENAAPLLAQAFAALPAGDAKSASYLAQGQQALALLHKAAARGQCRYPVDLTRFPDMPLPHLPKIKAGCQLLGREAMANAAKGQTDLAAQSILHGLRLARSLEQEPLLISQLVRIASDAAMATSLENALSLRPFSEQQLQRLQAAVREESVALGQCLSRPLVAERCSVVRLFQMTPQEYEKLSGSAGTNAPFGTPAERERYRKSAASDADFGLCLDYLSNALAVASLPSPACLEAAGQLAPEGGAPTNDAGSKGRRLCLQFLPALTRAFEREADSIAQLRAAEAALAVERYRADDHSELPASLDQLVPKYLAAVPEDPFDGKPLQFRKLSPKGFVVSSIGRDGQDAGGAPRQAAKGEGGSNPGFMVKR